MTKREDESDRRNPEWMWVTVAGTRNPFPGRKQQHEPEYGSQCHQVCYLVHNELDKQNQKQQFILNLIFKIVDILLFINV